jgi:hypothetical protein
MSARKKKPPKFPRNEEVVRNAVRGPIGTKPKARWWQRTWVKLAGMGGLVAAILSAPMLINNFVHDAAKLPDTYGYVSAWVRGDKYFAGEWTNDLAGVMKYSVGPPLEGLEMRAEPGETSSALAEQGAVSLKLEVKDGLVTGVITSQEIRKTFIYSHLFVSGVVSFGTLEIHVWDYISGTARPIAELKAHWERVGDEGRLEFTSGGFLFPEHFYVERGAGPKPSFNLGLVKRLISEQNKANASNSKDAVK